MATIVDTIEGGVPILVRNARSRISLSPLDTEGTMCKVASIDRSVREYKRPLYNNTPALASSTAYLAVLTFFLVVTVCGADPLLPSGFVSCSNMYLVRNGKPFVAKGMNYYPRDAPWYRFWPNLDDRNLAAAVSNDLDTAQMLGVNTVRLFLPYSQFTNAPANSAHTNALNALLNQLAARDMLAILTLFDLYPNCTTNDYQPVDYDMCTNHICFVVNTVGPTNPVVMAWDIKNEPDRDWTTDVQRTVVTNWLGNMIRHLRTWDTNHLVTIGFYSATGQTTTLRFDASIAATLSESLDIVSIHYSLPEEEFPSAVSSIRTQAPNKPIILEEFAIHTCTDPQMVTGPIHAETQQIPYYNALLAHSEASGLAGMLFWTLRDYSWLMPGEDHKQAHEGLVRLDGSWKPAFLVVREHFVGDHTYLDRFDGYVARDAHAPPVGWKTPDRVSTGAHCYNLTTNGYQWPSSPSHVTFSREGTDGTNYVLSPPFPSRTLGAAHWLSFQIDAYTNELRGTNCLLTVDIVSSFTNQILTLTNVSWRNVFPSRYNMTLPSLPSFTDTTYHLGIRMIPELPSDGYKSGYEFDWIRIGKRPADVCLAVESAHGLTEPPAGKWWFGSGDAVTVSVVKAVAEMDGTQYVCAGWVRTGNTTTSGVGTNMQIDHLMNDTTVTWVWTPTNYWLDIGVVGSGVVDRVSGWIQTNTAVTVTTTTGSTDFVFCGWCGDTNGCTITGTNIAVTMSSPRAIAPVFLWSSWLFDHRLTTNDAMRDTDNDGIATWQEWVAGTDPTNGMSYPRLSVSPGDPGSTILKWTGEPDVVYSVLRSTSLTTPFWFKGVSTSLTGQTFHEVKVLVDNEPVLFHRFNATRR